MRSETGAAHAGRQPLTVDDADAEHEHAHEHVQPFTSTSPNTTRGAEQPQRQ